MHSFLLQDSYDLFPDISINMVAGQNSQLLAFFCERKNIIYNI